MQVVFLHDTYIKSSDKQNRFLIKELLRNLGSFYYIAFSYSKSLHLTIETSDQTYRASLHHAPNEANANLNDDITATCNRKEIKYCCLGEPTT
ncbi:hypothetical protein CDAR_1151 [Caerostris darwini]|uniref:Uncharacterized protein n=1 Tax=Caerostris darwini TaxID=1538125 RepID=A0AAV4SQN4_9ARAC|nr:hypothetical protein CDAR_961 [Caerostris darwini]GIY35312.1 hypothetical protein CDAR_1151 [Caerostris darwini]